MTAYHAKDSQLAIQMSRIHWIHHLRCSCVSPGIMNEIALSLHAQQEIMPPTALHRPWSSTHAQTCSYCVFALLWLGAWARIYKMAIADAHRAPFGFSLQSLTSPSVFYPQNSRARVSSSLLPSSFSSFLKTPIKSFARREQRS